MEQFVGKALEYRATSRWLLPVNLQHNSTATAFAIPACRP